MKGRALGECHRNVPRRLLAAILLLILAPAAFSGGQGESRLQDATALIAQSQAGSALVGLTLEEIPSRIDEFSSEELVMIGQMFPPDDLLDVVGILIADKRFNGAAVILSGVVLDDKAQLERAEQYFRVIRDANAEYVAKGEEVRAKLQELLRPDLAPEELLPTAIEALGLITEMEEILPNRNTRDTAIIEDLRYTVQLNIDRRRFQALMDAAAARLEVGDYPGAVDIYVNGLDETDALTGSTDTTSDTITLENGLNIQRRFFEERDYGLLGDQVAGARESVRSVGQEFVQTAPGSLQKAADLAAAFEAGDFSNLETRIDEYLNDLETLTSFAAEVDADGQTLTDAESFVSQQASASEDVRYDWHIRFLRDIVLGREGRTGEEGLLVALRDVQSTVETGPVAAARAFADDRYDQAVAAIAGISWPDEATGFQDMPGVNETVATADNLLMQSSHAYRTYVRILAVAAAVEVTVPDPPAAVGTVEDGEISDQWTSYTSAVSQAVADLSEIGDGDLRGNVASGNLLAASASSLRRLAERAAQGLGVASTRRTTISALQSQRAALVDVLGVPSNPGPGTLRTLLDQWQNLSAEAADIAGLDERAVDALSFNEAFTAARIVDMQRYDLNIVERIASIEYNGLSSRVSSFRSRNNEAARQLDGVRETVQSVDDTGRVVRDSTGAIVTFQTVRNYPDRARDILVPMVGRVSGTRIISTSNGEYQAGLDDVRAFLRRYEQEFPYIVSAPAIQDEITRGRALETTIGEATGTGLFGEGRGILQRALDTIAEAEDLESQGNELVGVIRGLIQDAIAANEAENIELAGNNIARAELLLKSDDQRVTDASDLFTESLATWYRPDLEARWNSLQAELNDRIAQLQADIVITRVQQTVREAQPLVDDQQWVRARSILQEADDLWSNVFPTTVYPPLVRLLRYVETALAKLNERTLREDDPDYDKLAPLLSRATQAVSDGLYDTARSLLDQFLRAQPNNYEARLLEVDIALLADEGDLTSKVNRLIDGALPEGVSRNQIASLDAADALELQSLLIALLDRLEQRADASGALLRQISGEIDTLENILSPPPVVVSTPDIRAESNALVDRAYANGPLETLSASQLTTALGFLEQALNVDPTNSRAIDALSLALRLPNAPRRTALDATEQQIFKQARDEFSRGQLTSALRLVEQLWADPENRNDTELNRFREELLDAIRRGG